VALFRSNEQNQIEAVKVKLDAARADVAAAEVTMHSLALDVALSSDENAFRDAMRELRDARDRAEVLAHALQVAEQREVDRLAAARASLRSSQNKAVRQFIAAMKKESLVAQTGYDNIAACWQRTLKIADQIKRQLPPDDRSGFGDFLSPGKLGEYWLLHYARHAARHGFDGDQPSPPGCMPMPVAGLPHGTSSRDLEPLSVRLTTHLLRFYDNLVGNAAASPAPDKTRPDAEPPQPEPPPPPTPIVDVNAMMAIEGPDAVRQALIERGLADARAARREVAPIPAEPDPADDEPHVAPHAEVGTRRASAAMSALFGR
jgi:hypothetical protein